MSTGSSPIVSNQAPEPTVKDLLRIESRLNLAFYAAVISLLFYIVISLFLLPALVNSRERTLLFLPVMALYFLAFCGYVWYLVSICLTAKAINKRFGLYLAWAIGGPILSLLPIPFVSTALGATPLIIKFLLTTEIQTLIRLRTLRDLH